MHSVAFTLLSMICLCALRCRLLLCSSALRTEPTRPLHPNYSNVKQQATTNTLHSKITAVRCAYILVVMQTKELKKTSSLACACICSVTPLCTSRYSARTATVHRLTATVHDYNVR
eukprot:4018-Heterococcus_DN1.PRE.2